MAKTEAQTKPQHLDINGLSGRMIHLPAPEAKTSELLFVLDRHSSLERWTDLLEYLNHFGAVTAPDLPGIGGMDSFYTIGRKPSLDAYADYLAAFITLRFRRKVVSAIGVGFGFVVITRMLQRYPKLTSRIRLVVSLDGYARHDDLSPARHPRLRWLAYRSGSWYVPAMAAHAVYLNRTMLPNLVASSQRAQAIPDLAERELYVAKEVSLWRQNDLRTRWHLAAVLMRFSNCDHPVNVPLWHIGLAGQTTGRRHNLEQRLRVIYNDTTCIETSVTPHQFHESTAKYAVRLFPAKLRTLLTEA